MLSGNFSEKKNVNAKNLLNYMNRFHSNIFAARYFLEGTCGDIKLQSYF